MTSGGETSPEVLGFLTVLEHDGLGLVGGYLLLNAAGRPLEFHCTAPVKPNRAQQILFGPTLAPYLYGEQIGGTLLATGSHQPLAVYTDVERVLAVRDFVSPPVALVLGQADEEAAGASPFDRPDALSPSPVWRVDAPHRPAGHLTQFTLGRNRLAVAASRDADRDAICTRLQHLAAFDLTEPFGRIREAVEEAHKGNRAT
jgi:hypothetical protein